MTNSFLNRFPKLNGCFITGLFLLNRFQTSFKPVQTGYSLCQASSKPVQPCPPVWSLARFARSIKPTERWGTRRPKETML